MYIICLIPFPCSCPGSTTRTSLLPFMSHESFAHGSFALRGATGPGLLAPLCRSSCFLECMDRTSTRFLRRTKRPLGVGGRSVGRRVGGQKDAKGELIACVCVCVPLGPSQCMIGLSWQCVMEQYGSLSFKGAADAMNQWCCWRSPNKLTHLALGIQCHPSDPTTYLYGWIYNHVPHDMTEAYIP